MTPNRSLLLAVLCLGLLSSSGREARAQSILSDASNAYGDLLNGYDYADAAFQDLLASEGNAAYATNAAYAYEVAYQAQLYAGYDSNGQSFYDAYEAAYFAALANNYAYYAYFDNPTDNSYAAWYFLSQGAIAAQNVVNDILSIGY